MNPFHFVRDNEGIHQDSQGNSSAYFVLLTILGDAYLGAPRTAADSYRHVADTLAPFAHCQIVRRFLADVIGAKV